MELSDKRNGTSGLDSVGVAVNGMYVKWQVSFIPPCLTGVGCCKGCSFEIVAILLLLAENKIPH